MSKSWKFPYASHLRRFASRVVPTNSSRSRLPLRDGEVSLTDILSQAENGTFQNRIALGNEPEPRSGESSEFSDRSLTFSRADLWARVVSADDVEAGRLNIPPVSYSTPPGIQRQRRQDQVPDLVSRADEFQDDKEERTKLEICLDYLYGACLIPMKLKFCSAWIWTRNKVMALVQLVVFWIVTGFSILHSLTLVKHSCLMYLVYGGLERFTNMGFFIMNTLTKTYAVRMFTQKQEKIDKMIQSIRKLRKFAAKHSKSKRRKPKGNRVILLLLLSLTMSTLSVIFNVGVTNWSPEKAVLSASGRMGEDMDVWTPDSLYNNGTGLTAINKEYGEKLTTRNTVFGILTMATELCGRVVIEAIRDYILITALDMQEDVFHFANEIGNPDFDINPVNMANLEAANGQWEHYLLLMESIDDINDVNESLLKYIHVDNLAMIVYLAMNAFSGELSAFTILYFIYNIIKASCTYRIAAKAAQKNEVLRDWIRRLALKSSDAEFTLKAYFILDRLHEKPIGLGKGQFMIDDSFLFRFSGTVGSVFVLQAQSRDDE